MAALGDGADWIWAGYAQHLPHRVEILDFYHVRERLAEVATAMFGNGAADRIAAKQWRESQEKELLEWRPRRALEELEGWGAQTAAAQRYERINCATLGISGSG